MCVHHARFFSRLAAMAAAEARVLCVCLGNICRSPLAHVLVRDAAARAGLAVEVDSCGTAGYHVGDRADPRSEETATRHGLDLSRHSGRQLDPRVDFDRFDLVLCMDDSNLSDVLKARRAAGKEGSRAEVRKMLEFASDEARRGGSVPDPYYGGDDGFEKVYRMLEDSAPRALAHLAERLGLKRRS